ncbi:hypothetical protein IHE44_0011339 [Lamprotornis superbus]|uniref:Peptidase M1 leukotriene A4 hydrolase/aminopeptidase C-terminal domain-containing protein n=1 Tax=Lamprotornis superbus TaxID=245042 RepID=A0A835NPV8_9PASS|nr:hypothetical protein IHE44_0011339 [Lamprotornis superbus]
MVLLLESLLEEKTLCPRILQCLERTYQLREQDAEVRHRWCELVVKHKYEPGYGDIERFLREDQAMGVYLYGELMVNEDAKQQDLARKCFAAAREHMDASSAKERSQTTLLIDLLLNPDFIDPRHQRKDYVTAKTIT